MPAAIASRLTTLFSFPESLRWEGAHGRQHIHVNTAHVAPRRGHPRRSSSLASFGYASHIDDEVLEGRKIYKNPRNAPSITCPRDEDAIVRTVSGRKRMITMWTPVIDCFTALLGVCWCSRLFQWPPCVTGTRILDCVFVWPSAWGIEQE